MTKPTGRPSLFTPKDGTKTYRVKTLTKWGEAAFEKLRTRITKAAGWSRPVSDADVIETLLRNQKD